MPETGTPGPEGKIGARSREFLTERFTLLRDNLAEQVGAGEASDPEQATRELAVHDAVLSVLSHGGPLPDGDAAREYVAEVARAVDEASGYEQATLEHRAFAELLDRLAAP
jgi:hypothetical protein